MPISGIRRIVPNVSMPAFLILLPIGCIVNSKFDVNYQFFKLKNKNIYSLRFLQGFGLLSACGLTENKKRRNKSRPFKRLILYIPYLLSSYPPLIPLPKDGLVYARIYKVPRQRLLKPLIPKYIIIGVNPGYGRRLSPVRLVEHGS